jgi:hypothetical protein
VSRVTGDVTGPGQVEPEGQLQHALALGPGNEGWASNLVAWTLALEVRARGARGPRSSSPTHGQSRLLLLIE